MEDDVKALIGDVDALKLYAKDKLASFKERYGRDCKVVLIPSTQITRKPKECYAIMSLVDGTYVGYVLPMGEIWDHTFIETNSASGLNEDVYAMLNVVLGTRELNQIPTCMHAMDMNASFTTKHPDRKLVTRSYVIDSIQSMKRINGIGSILFTAADLVNFSAHVTDKQLAKELCKAYYTGLYGSEFVVGHPRSPSTDSFIADDWTFYKVAEISFGVLLCERFYASSLLDYNDPSKVGHEVEEIVGALQRSTDADPQKLIFTVRANACPDDPKYFTRSDLLSRMKIYSEGFKLTDI